MVSFRLLQGSAFVWEIEPMGLGYPEDTLKVLRIPVSRRRESWEYAAQKMLLKPIAACSEVMG